MRSWRQTDNALEGTASLHSDLLLPLDEIGQLDPSKAGAVAYMLANGQGKGRAARDGTSRAIAKFQLMFLSSGEVSLGDLVTESGGTQRAGQDVRVIDMAADAGAGFGMFECLPQGVSAGEFADRLRAASRTHYGHALPAFLQGITASTDATRTKLRADRDALTDAMVGRSESQVRRVAQRFALIGAAGELATNYGITGWPAGEAMRAAKTCFAQWREARGTEGNSEPDVLMSQVCKFLETHGDSRFEPMDRDRDPMKVINRAGFSRLASGSDAREYLVLPEAFKEIVRGHNPAWAKGVLTEAGWLKPGADRITQRVRVHGLSDQLRVYVIDGGQVHGGAL
jgi:putative DNA primase/helicase